MDAVIAFTYGRLQVSAGTNGLVGIDYDLEGDGTVEGSIALTLNSESRATAIAVTQAATQIGSANVSYDPAGRLTSITTTFTVEDRTVTATTTNTYDATGKVTQQSQVASDGMRTETVASAAYTYDAAGRLSTLITTSVDTYGRTTFNYIMDTHTLVVLRETGTSAFALTYRGRDQYVYDARGSVTTKVLADDADVDGVFEKTNTTNTTNTTYNEDGLRSAETFETVVADAVTYRSTYALTYDDARLTRETTASDTNGDGTIEDDYTSTFTYDGAGRLTLRESRRQPAGGAERTISTTERTYDANGHVLTIGVKDFDEVGALEDQQKTTYTYNADGTLLRETREANGVPFPSGQTYRYGPVSNALVAKFQEGVIELSGGVF